jgi:hypothetical protein
VAAQPLVRDRLLEAMVEEGLTKPDGTPNKRGLARRLCELNGEDPRVDLEKWEQSVFRWTRKENPIGMSDESAEFVAQALNRDKDYFKAPTVVADVMRERADLADRVDRLEELIERVEKRLQSLES